MRLLYTLAVVSGCIYAEPINQRPSLDIERKGATEAYRGDTIQLHAIANDPEQQFVHFQWRAYLCTTASLTLDECDKAPFYTDIREDASFQIPRKRADADVPVEQILVLLEGQDAYGATADPIQQLVITVSDHAPTLELRKDSRFGYVVNVPLNVYATTDDLDDNPSEIELTWKVYSPMTQPLYDFTDIAVPGGQFGKQLRPKGIGDWEVEVTATDALGRKCLANGGTDCAVTVKRVMITVVADHPPCLSQWAPITPPVGETWKMFEATSFQVNVVQDDLDPFPGFPSDSVLGTTTFHWSLRPPGASTRDVLGVDSNHVTLDPAAGYSPGDILELRVEIEDRNHTPVNCTDSSPTCSVISDNNCLQRLTWRVEVR